MMTSSAAKRLSMALYLNAALLAAIAGALLLRDGGSSGLLPAALAQHQAPIAGGAGVFIMPGQFSPNTFGCYLLDVDSQSIAAYQFYPGEKELRLVAARTYRWDRRLSNYNTSRPSPVEVRELVEKEQNGARMNLPPAPDAPPPPSTAP